MIIDQRYSGFFDCLNRIEELSTDVILMLIARATDLDTILPPHNADDVLGLAVSFSNAKTKITGYECFGHRPFTEVSFELH